MDIDNIDNVMTALKKFENKVRYEKLCELTEKQKEEYNKLLEELKIVNSSKSSSMEKGKTLEKIATFVLKSANIFDIYNNVRNSTNEIDQLVRVNNTGKFLCSNGIIDKRLKNFIGECKNYNKKVDVTYVGKVCSLLETTKNKICIFFSYFGITGKDWNDASGLIRKFYLSKEDVDERFCIIDFNLDDFVSIKNGNNILQIIEDKIFSLQNDTNYSKFLSPHDFENKIVELQEI